MTETSALATRSIVRITLTISGLAVSKLPIAVALPPCRFQPPVLRLDFLNVEGAADDQAEFVDVDRLAVKIIGAERNRLERAFAGAMARGDDDLGVGLQAEDFRKGRETFRGAVGIGRKAKVERHDRGLVQAHHFDRLGTVGRAHYAIAFIGPFQLALQPLVILDDQQDRQFGGGLVRRSCAFPVGFWPLRRREV